MRGKYIDTTILLACRSKKAPAKKAPVIKDIHTQLKETIAEHQKICEQFHLLTEMLSGNITDAKDALKNIPQELLKINHLS
jgi:hypothetical protein